MVNTGFFLKERVDSTSGANRHLSTTPLLQVIVFCIMEKPEIRIF